MIDELQPKSDSAIGYLRWLNEDAPIYLEHMESVGPQKPKAKTYQPHDVDSAKRFVTANNASKYKRNIYYMPNAGLLNGKRRKANVSGSAFLWVDLDCKDYPGDESEQRDEILGLLVDERRRPNGVPKPTALVFTGGGYQALWKLNEPISTDEAERLNITLLMVFGGAPGPVAVSQLLRLPGTVNWLSDKKRSDGRDPAMALLFDPANFKKSPTEYGVDEFSLPKFKETESNSSKDRSIAIQSVDIEPLPLPEDLSEILPSNPDWVEAIVSGEDPPGKFYLSRSELVIGASCWMLGKGVAPGHVLSILLDENYEIGAHVREDGNPIKYGLRQVFRAMAYLAESKKGWPSLDDDDIPVKHHPNNVRYALLMLGVDARFNKFSHSGEVTGHEFDNRDLNDVCKILSSQFFRELDFYCNPTIIERELIAMAHEQAYHPILDYLDGLEWDETPRLDTWLKEYCGADDNELNKEFGSKILIAAVRRVKEPGVKFDTMLVLEGPQGTSKSSLVAKLAINDDWFCDTLDLRSDDKTKAELLASAWIVECQELDGMNKVTSQSLKRFVTTKVDKYRKAYARDAGAYKRHCIILGTTNEDTYLRDLSGNRRFWSVRIKDIDLARFSGDVHQLWAEAVAREAEGESIFLSKHLWDEATQLQLSRMVEDSFDPVLEGWFAERTGRVSLESVRLLLNIEGGDGRSGDGQRIKAVMIRLGWNYGNHRLGDLAQSSRASRKGYARGTTDEREFEWIAVKRDGLTALVSAKNDSEPPF